MKELSKNVVLTQSDKHYSAKKDTYCPSCGSLLDACTQVMGEESGPAEGGFSFCSYCAELLMFNADLSVRVPTVAELVDLPPDVQLFLDKTREGILKCRTKCRSDQNIDNKDHETPPRNS